MDQCVNVVSISPVMTLGAAIVIVLNFIVAVMLIFADLDFFENGKKRYSRILGCLLMVWVVVFTALQFIK